MIAFQAKFDGYGESYKYILNNVFKKFIFHSRKNRENKNHEISKQVINININNIKCAFVVLTVE